MLKHAIFSLLMKKTFLKFIANCEVKLGSYDEESLLN